jgi:hypothetical protein
MSNFHPGPANVPQQSNHTQSRIISTSQPHSRERRQRPSIGARAIQYPNFAKELLGGVHAPSFPDSSGISGEEPPGWTAFVAELEADGEINRHIGEYASGTTELHLYQPFASLANRIIVLFDKHCHRLIQRKISAELISKAFHHIVARQKFEKPDHRANRMV